MTFHRQQRFIKVMGLHWITIISICPAVTTFTIEKFENSYSCLTSTLRSKPAKAFHMRTFESKWGLLRSTNRVLTQRKALSAIFISHFTRSNTRNEIPLTRFWTVCIRWNSNPTNLDKYGGHDPIAKRHLIFNHFGTLPSLYGYCIAYHTSISILQ
jgi:hypothetical protein